MFINAKITRLTNKTRKSWVIYGDELDCLAPWLLTVARVLHSTQGFKSRVINTANAMTKAIATYTAWLSSTSK